MFECVLRVMHSVRVTPFTTLSLVDIAAKQKSPQGPMYVGSSRAGGRHDTFTAQGDVSWPLLPSGTKPNLIENAARISLQPCVS